jgi:hypothetical protein
VKYAISIDLLAKDRSVIDPESIFAFLIDPIQNRSRIDPAGIIAEPVRNCLDTNPLLDMLAGSSQSMRFISFELNFTGYWDEQDDLPLFMIVIQNRYQRFGEKSGGSLEPRRLCEDVTPKLCIIGL